MRHHHHNLNGAARILVHDHRGDNYHKHGWLHDGHHYVTFYDAPCAVDDCPYHHHNNPINNDDPVDHNVDSRTG